MTLLQSENGLELYYTKNQGVGAKTVTITFGGDEGWDAGYGADVVAGSTSFYGVDQTNPISAVAYNTSSSALVVNYKLGTSADNMFFDNIGTLGGTTITPATGQIKIWSRTIGNLCGLKPVGGNSMESGRSGYNDMNWTISASKYWQSQIIQINASVAAPSNTAPNSSLVYLLNGSAGTTLGTPFKNNPQYFNASGNCSDLENATLRGNFTYYLNGTAFRTYLTYNWVANQTNYTNSSTVITGLNKSDSLFVGLSCYDGGLWSNQTNSTAITINNTAPTITAPSINNTAPLQNDTLLCNNGTYSDADSDAIGTGYWRWWLNDTEIPGQTAQTLNLTAITVNETDRINCSYRTEDSGYDVKNSTEMFSTSRTIAVGCGTIMTDKTLTANLTKTGTCITFGADNIILNCNGARIFATTYQIYAQNRQNITIKNCIHTGTTTSTSMIYLDNVNNSKFFNNTGIGYTTASMFYLYGNHNLIANSTYSSAASYGVQLSSASRNNLTNVSAYSSSYQIYLSGGTANLIHNCSTRAGAAGIRLESSTSNNITQTSMTFSTSDLVLGTNANGNLIANSSFAFGTNKIYLFGNSRNGVSLNNTFDAGKNYVFEGGSCSPCNITTKHYGRINITNSTGGIAASYTDVDALGFTEAAGTTPPDGLTDWKIFTNSTFSSSGTTAFNPHTVTAYATGYTIKASSFSWGGNDWTFNITLSGIIPKGVWPLPLGQVDVAEGGGPSKTWWLPILSFPVAVVLTLSTPKRR